METRERPFEDEAERRQPDSTAVGPAGQLPELREAGQRFLNAGNDAINRALSHDSEAFLSASRQRGGE
jgi:hypothetical protein